MDPYQFRSSGFYDASRRLCRIGESALYPMSIQPPVDNQVCDDGTAANEIRLRVIYYDALAEANGVYQTLGVNSPALETNAAGIDCELGGTSQTTAADGTTTFSNLNNSTRHTVELSAFRATGDSAAYMSIHSECGTVHTARAGVPIRRNSFEVDQGALYTIRIWLRPRSLVLHWTAGSRRVSSNSRDFYHFLIDGTGDPVIGGRIADDPRFWRHNLHVAGMPPNAIQGLNDVNLRMHRGLGSEYARWNRENENGTEKARSRVILVNSAGYGRHAGGFNTNAVSISVCAMGGCKQSEPIKTSTAITNDQVDGLVEFVASLCRAWHMDATSVDDVCTHYEANVVHDASNSGKWDITWLPEEKQDAYRNANSQELCATEADPLDYTRVDDVALGRTYPNGVNQTDRVSAYLRELIAAAI